MSNNMWGDKDHAAGNKARFMERERQRNWDKNHKDPKSSGQGVAPSGLGCLVVILVLVLVVLIGMVLKPIGVGFRAASNLETIQSFDFNQYFLNIIHLDQNALFEVGPQPLSCYESAIELDEAKSIKSMFILESGQKFVYRGYSSKENATSVAIQLWQHDKPIYGYLLVEQEWKGNTFRKHDDIEEVIAVDMYKMRNKALKDLPQLIFQNFTVLEIPRKDAQSYLKNDDYVNMSSLIAPISSNYMQQEKRQTFYFLSKEDFKKYRKFKKNLKDEQRIWQKEAQLAGYNNKQ